MRLLKPLAIPLFVTAALAAGLVTAGPAAADVVNGGTLTVNVAKATTIGIAGRDVDYTFAATKDVGSTIDVTASAWGSGNALVEIFTPTNQLYVACGMQSTPTFCKFTPNVTGNWKLRIDPQLTATGSATVVYAQDLDKGVLPSGTAVTTAIARRGQDARATFAATTGVPTTFNVTASSWGTNAAYLYFFAPGSNTLFSNCNITQKTQCTIYPNATGTWRMTLDPQDAATGSSTIVYAQDQVKGALALNTPSATTVGVAYQDVHYTFAGTANTHLSVDVKDTAWGTGTTPPANTNGSAILNIYMPDGTLYVQCPIAAAATFCDFTPNTTGTWKAKLDPLAAATGKATLTLVADKNLGPLAVGATVAAPIAAKGQNATLVLPATGSTPNPATLRLTGTTFASSYLYFYAPTGNTLYDFCAVVPGTTECTFYPSFAGNWRVTLDPLEGTTGTTSVKRLT